MIKNYIKIFVLTSIFIFFFCILNSSGITLISPEYYQWLSSNIEANHQSVLLYFLGLPFLYLFGTLLLIYLYLTLRGNIVIQGISIFYVTLFVIFYISPNLRYENIGHEYTVSESMPSMVPYHGTLYENTTRMILVGDKVRLIDFRINDTTNPDRVYIPFLCTDDARCFIPTTGYQHEYYRTPIDARKTFFRIFS